MKKLTTKQLLELIEAIVSDDFCSQSDSPISPLIRDDKTRSEKLIAIYKAVHSHAGHCKNPHLDWREEAVKEYKVLKKQNII